MNSDRPMIQKYGKWIIFVVAAVLLGSVIFQYGEYQKNKLKEKASIAYETMMSHVLQQNLVKAAEQGALLVEEYKASPYAVLGALMLSKMALDQNNEDGAIEQLQQAVKLAEKTPLEDIARVRLSRVLLSKQRYDEALAALPDEKKNSAFAMMALELKGDIYFGKKEWAKAKTSYEKAIQASSPSLPMTPIHLKYNDLHIKEET